MDTLTLALVARLTSEAETDYLTGLPNRRGLDRRAPILRGAYYVAADLDGFKRAQDRHPRYHAYGDDILRSFALFLRANTREADSIACRQGGDEFLVRVGTRAGAERVRDAILAWRSQDGKVKASAGAGRDTEAADLACRVCKAGRRNLFRRGLDYLTRRGRVAL